MNRCALCGRFRSWEWLVAFYSVELAGIYGGIQEDEWYECARGKGCQVAPPSDVEGER